MCVISLPILCMCYKDKVPRYWGLLWVVLESDWLFGHLGPGVSAAGASGISVPGAGVGGGLFALSPVPGGCLWQCLVCGNVCDQTCKRPQCLYLCLRATCPASLLFAPAKRRAAGTSTRDPTFPPGTPRLWGTGLAPASGLEGALGGGATDCCHCLHPLAHRSSF